MSQKVAGMVHAEMNLERGIRASKPRHQSVQKWPSSMVVTSRCVLVQSREIAVVMESIVSLATR